MLLKPRRVRGNPLKIGSPVQFDCYDQTGRLLLKKGYIVETQNQVTSLLNHGLYRVDFSNELEDTIPTKEVTSINISSPFRLLNDFNERLKRLFHDLNNETRIILNQETETFTERVMEMAKVIQKLCRADSDALLGKIHLDNSERYSILHPLHRAIVSELLAIRENIPEQIRLHLIAASLTCDMSIQKLQDVLVCQKGPLEPHQRQIIASHPVDTVNLLKSLGVSNPVWLTTIIQHHEQLNGNGYPYGLSGHEITSLSRILKLADMYTAMTSARTYRKALLNTSTMRDILLRRGSEIDEDLAVSIIKVIGIYPPGAFVKLMNGDIAIVIRRSSNPKTPFVKALMDIRGALYKIPVKRKTDYGDYQIHDVIDHKDIIHVDMHKLINLHKLWDYQI